MIFAALKRWFTPKPRPTPINVNQCPCCLRWDRRELDPPNRWEAIALPNRASGDEYIKTCGACGYKSHWIDIGFMGLMACTDQVVPAQGVYYEPGDGEVEVLQAQVGINLQYPLPIIEARGPNDKP